MFRLICISWECGHSLTHVPAAPCGRHPVLVPEKHDCPEPQSASMLQGVVEHEESDKQPPLPEVR